jgi:hypothetical protein
MKNTENAIGGLLHRACSALAPGLAGQQSDIIRTCINEALGNEAWIIGDLANRMVRVRVVGQESETITLDGKPLLEIWPTEMKTVQEGNSWKMVATVKYRTFKAQNGLPEPSRHDDARKTK